MNLVLRLNDDFRDSSLEGETTVADLLRAGLRYTNSAERGAQRGVGSLYRP